MDVQKGELAVHQACSWAAMAASANTFAQLLPGWQPPQGTCLSAIALCGTYAKREAENRLYANWAAMQTLCATWYVTLHVSTCALL